MSMINLPFPELREDPENVRTHMDEVKLGELKASIERYGILQNLQVKCAEGGKVNVVVTGNRRLRAVGQLIADMEARLKCQDLSGDARAEVEARLKELFWVPCRVLTDAEAEEAQERQLVENLQREDISPVDEARGYEALRAKHGLSVEEIARRIGKGKTPQYVYGRLKLLRVPQRMLDALSEGRVSVRACEMVGRIPGAAERGAAVDEILNPMYQEEPLGTACVASLIHDRFMVSLDDANFELDDSQLMPVVMKDGERVSGGACKDCPFRSGNNAELLAIDGVATVRPGLGGRGGFDPNVCTHPACFRAKQEATWERLKAEPGAKVMKAAEAKRVFSGYGGRLAHGCGLVDLAEKPGMEEVGHADDRKVPRWETLVKGMDLPVILARNEATGRIHRLVERTVAIDAAVAAAKAKGKPSILEVARHQNIEQRDALRKEREAERERTGMEWAATHEMMRMVRESIIAQGMTKGRWEMVARWAINLAGADGQAVLRKWLAIDGGNDDGAAALVDYVADRVTLEADAMAIALIALSMRWGRQHPEGTPEFLELAGEFGVDRKSAMAVVRARKGRKPKGETQTVTRSESAARNQDGLAREEREAMRRRGK